MFNYWRSYHFYHERPIRDYFGYDSFAKNDKPLSLICKTSNNRDVQMNICEERHSPQYKIIYKGAKGCRHNHAWLVCQSCMENKKCFGDHEQILSVIEI